MQISVNGVKIDALDEGSGPATILLHGFPLAKELWDAQARALSASGRVVRIDLRGLGKSSVVPGPYLMETLAGDVAGVMDALRIERAAIVGHSAGGYIAFAFWRMFAERVTALGIVSSRASADDGAGAAARRALADRAEREGIEPVIDAFVPRYFAPDVYEHAPELVARARDMVSRTAPAGAAAMLRGMAERVASEDLFGEIDVPVCVIAGSRDAIIAPEEAQRIAAGVALARLHILECGHMPMWEAPDATTAILADLSREASG
jgi:pimeloyl-ACP methyl ester carboxylesterase